MKTIQLGKFFGLQVDVLPVTFWATFLLWIGLGSAAFFEIGIPAGESILIGLVATLLHWTSLLLHHLGHFAAARSTGYPMSGILFGIFGLLGRDLYPVDEPELPPAIHIRRALGGPIVSGVLSVIFFLLLPLWSENWYWLGLFILLENLFLFTLQVFIPLSFNDGGTILENLRRESP
jgi:hypothetical protein